MESREIEVIAFGQEEDRHTAHGLARRYGAELPWRAWKDPGDTDWNVEIAPEDSRGSAKQSDMTLVYEDGFSFHREVAEAISKSAKHHPEA